MGENGPGNPVFGVLLACVAASLLLAVIGFILHRRGRLRTSRPALAWAILTVVPLFGAGLAMYVKHSVDEATGVTQSGRNEPPLQNMP